MRPLTPEELATRIPLPAASLRAVLLAVLLGAVLLAPALALVASGWLEPWGSAAIPLAFAIPSAAVAMPLVARRSRARSIVRGGTRVEATIARAEIVGRASLGGGLWRLARVELDLSPPGRGPSRAVTEILVTNDPRIVEALAGRKVAVYWDARHPGEAVPEESLP